MVSDSKQNIISEFTIPDHLKDDIAYCQRSLRDCVKVHQHFAQQCKTLSGSQQAQVEGFLQELEDEMLAIGKDQNGLIQNLTERLKQFQRKASSERSVKLEDDLANGYVAWILSTHCEMHGATSYVPRAVSERLTETQLYQKYRLDVDRNMAVPEKQPRKRPVLQTSLLKPLAERIPDPGQQNKSKSPPTSGSTPSPPSPPGSAVAKITPGAASSKRKASPDQPIHAKLLRSRTSSMIPIKQETTPIKQEPVDEEQEPGNDSEESSPTASLGMQESAAVKRGRCNLRQALSKVKTGTQKVGPPSSVNKITSQSRSNRLAGGVGVACTPANGGERRSPSRSPSESSNSRASTPGTSISANVGGGGGVRKQEIASDESSNDRFLPLNEELPPQPCSTDELDQYGFLKQFGLYTIADSNLLKGRKNERKRRSCYSTERKDFHYGRLDFFEQQLYIMRRQGSNKRARLLYSAATAERVGKKRKPWSNGVIASPSTLLPPPLLPPSEQTPPMASAADASSVVEPLATASVTSVVNSGLTEPDSKSCVVCKESGSTDTLTTCSDCCNNYHSSCLDIDGKDGDGQAEGKVDPVSSTPTEKDLDDGDENQNHAAGGLFPQRENLCPICFALAKERKQTT